MARGGVDLDEALNTRVLGTYQDRDIIRSTFAITGAERGFKEGMSFNPMVVPVGQRVFVVLELHCDANHLKEIADTDCLGINNHFTVTFGCTAPADLVGGYVAEQRAAIAAAQARAHPEDGPGGYVQEERLPFDPEGDDEEIRLAGDDWDDEADDD